VREHAGRMDDAPEPCPSCATPVPARPSGIEGIERGSCPGCALQLVRDEGGEWREIRG